MANRYGERGYERYGREDYERGRADRGGYYGSSSEQRYRTGGSNIGRSTYGRESRYDYDRDYDTSRFDREGSYGSAGYNTGRDYDIDRESETGGYFTGSDYGRGTASGYGSYDRDYEYGRLSDYNRDYDRDYDRGYGSRNYTGSSSTNPVRGGGYGTGFSSRDYERNYGRDYSTRTGRGGSDYERNRFRSDYDYDERGFLDKATDEVASWFGDEDAAARRRMDARMGEHRGRGPKGYKRSDDRIKEDINDRLTYDSFIDASDIDVIVNSGEVVLSGTVNNRSAKRYAEDLAEQVSGVTNVENRLRVKQQDFTSATGATSGLVSSETTGATGTTLTGTTGAEATGKTSTAGTTSGVSSRTKTA